MIYKHRCGFNQVSHTCSLKQPEGLTGACLVLRHCLIDHIRENIWQVCKADHERAFFTSLPLCTKQQHIGSAPPPPAVLCYVAFQAPLLCAGVLGWLQLPRFPNISQKQRSSDHLTDFVLLCRHRRQTGPVPSCAAYSGLTLFFPLLPLRRA